MHDLRVALLRLRLWAGAWVTAFGLWLTRGADRALRMLGVRP